MKTTVTGGAGFIGGHLTDYLLARGDEVTVIDDLSTGSLNNLAAVRDHPNLTFVEGSILDRSALQSVVSGADRVFHLAAAVGVRRIVDHPLESLRTNRRLRMHTVGTSGCGRSSSACSTPSARARPVGTAWSCPTWWGRRCATNR
jgi:UDP-glucose 4-epimerase